MKVSIGSTNIWDRFGASAASDRHTLQSTALVHEVYLRLVDLRAGWRKRIQFVALAAQMMRRILVGTRPHRPKPSARSAVSDCGRSHAASAGAALAGDPGASPAADGAEQRGSRGA